MIISPGRKFIFVHAPKTGGTSLALALEARAMKDDIMLGDTPKARNRRRKVQDVQARGRLWKHATLADIDGLVETSNIPDFFTFTLVRNPWDRVVSYYHWLQEQTFDHPAVALSKEVQFTEFVQTALVATTLHASPARHYMTDCNGIEQCDAYIRLEHFAQDAASLIAHLGFDLPLERVNRSKRNAHYPAYYDEASRRAVAACCAEDIERFGYQFEAE